MNMHRKLVRKISKGEETDDEQIKAETSELFSIINLSVLEISGTPELFIMANIL